MFSDSRSSADTARHGKLTLALMLALSNSGHFAPSLAAALAAAKLNILD